MILCKRDIANISMAWVKSRTNKADLPYIDSPPGYQHYRLLTYIGMSYSDIKIADIGSRRGASAYAFAYNQDNTVFTYDIDPKFDIMTDPHRPKNVFFSKFNCVKYIDRVLDCYIIFLDVDPHDGIQELTFLDNLKVKKWNGILLLDDIHFNEPMRNFWKNVTDRRYDITEYGHCSGTGLINFSKEQIVLC